MSRVCINCSEDYRVTPCTSLCGENKDCSEEIPSCASDCGVPVPVLPAKAPPALGAALSPSPQTLSYRDGSYFEQDFISHSEPAQGKQQLCPKACPAPQP